MKKIKEIIIKYKGYLICILIICLSSLSIFIQNVEKNNQNKNKNSAFNTDIAVYITGEIKNSGVYYLKQGARLYELIDIAGGLTDDADIDSLNFALNLKDSDKIIISKKQEKNEKYEENDSRSISSKVNINTATKTELMSLDGIGSTYADKIISYRNTNRFDKIEDIMNVSGIGEAKFNKIKDSITVD